MKLKKLNKDVIAWGELLGNWCKFCHYKTIVEIGVQNANTTLHLCEAAKSTGGRVFGYDFFASIGLYKTNYGKLKVCQDKLKSFGNIVKLQKVDTTTQEFDDMLKVDTGGCIDFAFIDGCHSYKGVKNDFLKVYPYLSDVGTIVFHDTYSHIGPRKFILELYTDLNDGTFDIISLPYGNGAKRYGLTFLTKRGWARTGSGITNVSHDVKDKSVELGSVYKKEKDWIDEQDS